MLEKLWNKAKLLFSDFYFIRVFIITIALFIYKYQFLHLSYVFDELWVYGSCVREMGIKGPSLLPDALDVTYYRAHPLLFFFLGGIWTTIFGTSVFSTHIFASLISITFLYVMYFVSSKIFSSKVGFFAVLILSFQSIFLSQFSLVLPELLLTLFAILTVYYYIREEYWGYFISASLLVLTKESGVIVLVAIVLWNVITSFKSSKQFDLFKFFKSNLWLSLPVVFLLIHFVLLKFYFGWYFFPEHISEFDFNWGDFSWRIRKTLNYIFVDEGRQFVLIGFISVAILFNQKLSLKFKIFLLILFFTLTKIFFRYWKTMDIVEIYLTPILFIYFIRYIFWEDEKMSEQQQRFIGFSLVFTVLYTLFASSYFDNLRYLFYVFPFFIIVACYYISTITYLKNSVLPLFSVVCIIFSVVYGLQNKDNGDVNLTYSDVSKLYTKTIQYLEDEMLYDDPIKVPFLFKNALTRPLTSYLKSDRLFTNLSDNNNVENCEQCLILFTNTEPGNTIYKEIEKSPDFELVKTFKEGDVWSKLYKKII